MSETGYRQCARYPCPGILFPGQDNLYCTQLCRWLDHTRSRIGEKLNDPSLNSGRRQDTETQLEALDAIAAWGDVYRFHSVAPNLRHHCRVPPEATAEESP